jgi:pheromone shutdown-related protein TraB
MIHYKNVILVGTSHIAIESIKEVESSILENKPDLVAIELDPIRFQALLSKKRRIKISDIQKMGLKGFIFNLIGGFIEKQLGKVIKVKPGADMLKAIETSKKINAKILLIDQDIRITLKRLSKEITWKEKFTFMKEIFKAPFSKQKIKIDLTKVPSQNLIKQLVKKLRGYYPSIYKVLIEERNEILAKNIIRLMKTDKKILAVLGAGHIEGVLKIIKDQQD